MRGGIVAVLIALGVLIIVGFLIFSQNSSNYQQTGTNEEAQTETQQENNQTETGQETQNQPQTYNAEIRGYAFNPSSLTIKTGDTIVWTNADSVSHTVTSDSGNELNSAYLSKGNSYSHTFTQAGVFSYHCKPHSYMKGTIIVE